MCMYFNQQSARNLYRTITVCSNGREIVNQWPYYIDWACATVTLLRYAVLNGHKLNKHLLSCFIREGERFEDVRRQSRKEVYQRTNWQIRSELLCQSIRTLFFILTFRIYAHSGFDALLLRKIEKFWMIDSVINWLKSGRCWYTVGVNWHEILYTARFAMKINQSMSLINSFHS